MTWRKKAEIISIGKTEVKELCRCEDKCYSVPTYTWTDCRAVFKCMKCGFTFKYYLQRIPGKYAFYEIERVEEL